MAYSTDLDLELRRAGIRELLPDGGRQLRQLAEEHLLEDLELRWYRPAALARGLDWRLTPMDVTRLEPTQLKRLSVLKTLVYAHEHLMRYGQDAADGFERHRERYAREYEDELDRRVAAGLDYDWDENDTVSAFERAAAVPGRLERA